MLAALMQSVPTMPDGFHMVFGLKMANTAVPAPGHAVLALGWRLSKALLGSNFSMKIPVHAEKSCW
jgi:hypothetical protein